ncbi:MAG: hypothetical protein QXZ17_16225 [Nitrososphaerota archaeon]
MDRIESSYGVVKIVECVVGIVVVPSGVLFKGPNIVSIKLSLVDLRNAVPIILATISSFSVEEYCT